MTLAENFYLLNKTFHNRLPLPPSMQLTDRELASWLLNRSNFAWLELDVEINLDQWKKEILDCKNFLVNHRESESEGWRGACLHGINVEATGAWTRYGYSNEDDVPYIWTPLSYYCPTIKKFWETFPYDSYRRIRIMEVAPSGYINPHSDRPGKLPGEENFDALKFGVPINIAVIHPKDCYMTLEGHGCVPFQEGKAFLINLRNFHSVINFCDLSRYHVIGHGKLDRKVDEFSQLVARSFKKQLENEYCQIRTL